MSDLMLDVDQAGELKAAFRRGNWTNAEIKRLCEGTILADVRNLLLNLAEIKPVEHLINCDAAPFIPSGWKVLLEDQLPNRVTGSLKWNQELVNLYLSDTQRQGGVIAGHELKRKLADKPVLNANVLDYLLAHPHLIPEEWKGKAVFFWGTIYRDSYGNLCVRCLYWLDGGWSWNYDWLDIDWDSVSPAALRAS